MTIEDTLKEIILERYSSMREFTLKIDMPYSTLNTILKRGIQNAAVGNIITICSALHISADALAEGKIVTVCNSVPSTQINVEDILRDTKNKLLSADNILLDGEPLDLDSIGNLLDDIDVIIDRAKRQQIRKRQAQQNR